MSASLLRLIDHAVLQPTQTKADVRAACALARELLPASACVKPADVSYAAELLEGSGVTVGTVIGFPHGGTSTWAKVAEAEAACRDGASELDLVINLGLALEGAFATIQQEIERVASVARMNDALLKVILETGLLPDDALKVNLAKICVAAGADFVKTSTGFGMQRAGDGHWEATGATEHDVRLLRSACPEYVGVKASGGIRSLADARLLIAAGANRLGTSATAAIARELAGEDTSPTTTDY